MDFGDFQGNERLKRRLDAGLDKLPHSILICGPRGAGKKTLATLLAAALECTGEGERPCRRCKACRKVFSGQHPDVIVADDASKKIVPVSLVRQVCADIAVHPNEGNRKIYIFPRAQDLNAAAQNALLKAMEEPPPYGVFLLLTENAERQLPTIRSRCAQLTLSPLPPEQLSALLRKRFPDKTQAERDCACFQSGGYVGQAIELLDQAQGLLPQSEQFAEAFCAGSRLAILQVLAPMEKLKREQLLPVLDQWQALLEQAMRVRAGLPAAVVQCEKIARCRTNAELLRALEAIGDAREQAEANVGVGHICGALSVLL